jgi:hypothetical protein
LANVDETQIIKRLDELGASQVRLLFSSGGLPPGWNPTIVRWLSERDREERERNEASQTEQNQTTRSAKTAAWIAAIVAIVAAIIATVSMIIAWLAWRWPHAIVIFGFWLVATFFAVADEMHPFIVTFNVPLVFYGSIVQGNTNLPDGTKLVIWLKTPIPCRPNCQFTEAHSVVEGGHFVAGPFFQRYGLESSRRRTPQNFDDKFHEGAPAYGAYTLEIAVALNSQSAKVNAVIGTHGENLRGPLIEYGNGIPMLVHYTSDITILPKR